MTFHYSAFSFRLYFRLFIVMGVTYSISGLSYLISGSSTLLEFSEIFLSLQGVWIFLLFVLKRRILDLIKKRCVMRKDSMPNTENTIAPAP